MARHYVIQDWSNSATWSGEMIGDRLSKSKGHHFLKNGMANTEMYAGDEEEDFKKKSRVPIKNRILPQAARLDKLQAEIVELEEAYRSGEFSLKDYTLLRDVAFAKKARAETLYKKAISVKAPSYDDELSFNMPQEEGFSPYETCDLDYTYTEVAPSCGVSWIDELPRTNSFRPICVGICKTIVLLLKLKNYLNRVIKENE